MGLLVVIIVLSAILLGYILFLLREQLLRSSGTDVLVVQLRKKITWTPIFVGVLILYKVVVFLISDNAIQSKYDLVLHVILFLFIPLFVYTYFIRRPYLIFKELGIVTGYGLLDYTHITKVSINQRGDYVFRIFDRKDLLFSPLHAQDYEKIKDALVKFNVADLAQQQETFVEVEKLAQEASVYELQGVVQTYNWGGTKYIKNLLGDNAALAGLAFEDKIAEYWLGAHLNASSFIKDKKRLVNLSSFLSANPKQVSLHSKATNLPFLFKVLDVAQPLSIQIHPNKEVSKAGYDHEESLGIALTDPKRVFKDDNHKPELMLALSDFYLLHGFQNAEKTLSILEQRPRLEAFTKLYREKGIVEFYKYFMKLTPSQLKLVFAEHFTWVINEYKDKLETTDFETLLNPDYWVAYCIDTFKIDLENIDPGLGAFYIFNLLKLEKGQAIFQAQNVPHAYLRGQNLEAMAQSDNVIRGGLTEKYVDRAALVKHIDYTVIEPQILTPEATGEYPVPVADFNFTKLSCVQGQQQFLIADNAQILWVQSTSATGKSYAGRIQDPKLNKIFKFKAGQAYFVSANVEYGLTCDADVEIYIISFSNSLYTSEIELIDSEKVKEQVIEKAKS